MQAHDTETQTDDSRDQHHDHVFVPATDVNTTRSPCPALNALANHAYIPHDGKDIPYTTLVSALCTVYNISRPLAMMLATLGYLTRGKMSFSLSTAYFLPIPHFHWKLSLAALSKRGPIMIAHDAALVHPDGVPSHAPDAKLASHLNAYAASHHGISLKDFANIHAKKLAALAHPMSTYHEQVALGEYGLSWALMRSRKVVEEDVHSDVIPAQRIKQWITEEKLPDDWWTTGRPKKTVGILEARSNANIVKKLMGK